MASVQCCRFSHVEEMRGLEKEVGSLVRWEVDWECKMVPPREKGVAKQYTVSNSTMATSSLVFLCEGWQYCSTGEAGGQASH